MTNENSQIRILVVDDEQLVRTLVGKILGDAGYTVVEAASGKEALEKIKEGPLALIILDILMPQIDGYMFLELMPDNINIPVIMLSGLSEPSGKVTSFNLGADDYITKPFSAGELLARIQAKLRRTKSSS